MAAASAAALTSPALAQDAAPADPNGEGADQEIIVTAQLREQDPLEVPIALTAYSGEFLDALALDEFEDVARFVPGFDVQNQSPNNPGFVMRGITSDTGAAFGEPRVSVFQDGVAIGRPRGSYIELFDLERIEVARGPQTTLYGRSALIGAVNVIQNKADPAQRAGSFRGEFGNGGYHMAEAMANLPLAGALAARAAGRVKVSDGDVENLLGGRDFNSTDTEAARGLIGYGAGALRLDIIGNYQADRTNGVAFKSMLFNPTDPTTGAVLGSTDIDEGAALSAGAGFEGGRDLGLDRNVWGVTGLASLEIASGLTLSSITAYRRFRAFEIFDADGISLPLLTAGEDARGRQTSQEIRLVYDNEGPIAAFAGGSFFSEKGSQRVPVQFDERITLARLAGALNGPPALGRAATDPAPLAIFGNTAFTGALLRGLAAAQGVNISAAQATAIAANLKPAHRETTTNFGRTKAYDIFGDVTYRVTPQIELGAGARYTHDSKRSGITAQVLNGRSILGGFIGALGQPAAVRTPLLAALAVPGAANIPPSAAFPVPLFGLAGQPTANNGDLVSDTLKDNGFTWRMTARYEPTESSSLYAAYGRGRRPEVLSVREPSTPFGAARFDRVPAETVDSYELGAKTVLGGRRLFLDGALFYYKYTNFQTTEQQGVIFVTTNAGEAESYGFEGQARWTMNDNVRLFGTYGYNHSRFQTGVRRGNRFRLSPDHSASLGAMLRAPVAGGRIEFIPSVTYQSKVFFDDDNDRPELQQPPAALVADTIQDEFQEGFALVNARLGFETGMLRLEAFVENLFDKEYIRDAGNTGDAIGLPTYIPGEPRLFGISARLRLGD